MKRLRNQAIKEADLTTAHRFQVSDLVMVTCRDTSLKPIKKRKTTVKWQGPCEIVTVPTVSELYVRLLGDPPSIKQDDQLDTSTFVRRQGFYDHANYRKVGSTWPGEIQNQRTMRLTYWTKRRGFCCWYGFEDCDNTGGEIMTQAIEDNPYRVWNFLHQNVAGHPPPEKIYVVQVRWRWLSPRIMGTVLWISCVWSEDLLWMNEV